MPSLTRDGMINGAMARCYVTIEGNRYNAFNMKNLDVKISKDKTQEGVLGRTSKVNTATTLTNEFSGEMYYNQSVLRELMYRFKETGQDFYFDMQIVNEDPTSKVGRQSVILKGCNLNEITLAKFDVDASGSLTESVTGTYEDWEMPDSFDLLPGVL